MLLFVKERKERGKKKEERVSFLEQVSKNRPWSQITAVTV